MSNSTLIYTLMGVIVPIAIKSLLQSSSDLISGDPKIGIDLPTDPTASKSELTVTPPLYSLFYAILFSSIDNIQRLLLLAIMFLPTTSAIQAEPYRADGLDHTHDLDFEMILKAIQRGNLKQVQKSITNGFPVDYHKAGTSTVLMLAAHQGHVNVVKLLISEGASLNLKIGNGHTALMFAAQKNHGEIVKQLITAGSSLDLQQDDGDTALKLAAYHGHVNVVELLLGAEASLDLKDDNGRTALMMAAHHGHKEIVKQLIAAGANLDLKERFGITALITAAGQGHVNVVKQLITAGSSLDLRQDDGGTALMMAAHHGHKEIVKQLITAEAEVPVVLTESPLIKSIRRRLLYEYLNIKGTTKIMYGIKNNNIYFIQKALGLKPRNKLKAEHLFAAIESGHVNVVRYILNQKEGLKNAQGFSGTPPLIYAAGQALIYAAGQGHVNVVKQLIAAKASLNLRQDDGETALITAAYHGHVNVVKQLIAAKANLDLIDSIGNTALILAAYHGHVNVVKQLIAGKANLNLKADKGDTALILAAYHGHVNVVELLLGAEASLDLKDDNGRTALIFATYNGHEEIVKRLISAGADPNLEDINVKKASDHARDDDIKLYLNVYEFLFPTSIKLNISSISDQDYKKKVLLELLKKEPEKCIPFIEQFNIDIKETLFDQSLLYWATQANHYDLIAYLIDKGADLDQVIASVNEQDEIDIETENKLQTIKKYGISGLRFLNFLNTSRTQILSPKEAVSMKIQTEVFLDELLKQAPPILEDLSTELCSFVSLITDPRVMAMLVTTVVLITSAFWYLYTQKSLAMEKKVSDAEKKVSDAEKSTKEQNDKISDLEVQIVRRGEYAKLQKEKIIDAKLKTSLAEKRAIKAEQKAAVEKQNLVALRTTLKELETQLTELRTANKELENEVADFELSIGNYEKLKKQIDFVQNTIPDAEKVKMLKQFLEEAESINFICPISGEIMHDPVLATDGFTYEKSKIEEWFKENDTSPMTNLKIGTELVDEANYYDDIIRKLNRIMEGIKLLIQPEEALQAHYERLNPISGYVEVLSEYNDILDCTTITQEQYLEVFYGLSFISTQAAERSKYLLAEESLTHDAARHLRNRIMHPKTACVRKVGNETLKQLKGIIKALLSLPTAVNKRHLFDLMQNHFGELMERTHGSLKKALIEAIITARDLSVLYKASPSIVSDAREDAPEAGGGGKAARAGGGGKAARAAGGGKPARVVGAEYHISGSPDSATPSHISVALQGVYLQICNLIALPQLSEDPEAKRIQGLAIFKRDLRNASAHGEQPLTDEEIEMFCRQMIKYNHGNTHPIRL